MNAAVVPLKWMDSRKHTRSDGSVDNSAEHACWNANVRSAARRIVRLNEEDSTFVQVHILTLTLEIERKGGFTSSAAFYTTVANSLIVKANEWCRRRRLDVRKPELVLEHAADILAEVDVMIINNDVNDKDLITAVTNTRHGLVKADKPYWASCATASQFGH